MFLAVSRFTVANCKEQEVYDAFLARPRLVDQAPGFMRMEVATSTDDPREFWLLTYWHARSDYERWHRSHTYHESHGLIPKGLKLVRGRTEVSLLDIFA